MKKGVFSLFLFLLLSGISLRLLDSAITPLMQAIYSTGVSIDSIFYCRTVFQIGFSALLFLLFPSYWARFGCPDNYILKRAIHVVVLYCLFICFLILLTQNSMNGLWIIWVLYLPLELFMEPTYLIASSFLLGSTSFLAFIPMIFAPYILYAIWMRYAKRGEH